MTNRIAIYRTAVVVLIAGFLMLHYMPENSFLFAQQKGDQKEVVTDNKEAAKDSAETADKKKEAGDQDESEAGANAHLAKATEFRMDPAAWTLLILGLFGLAIALERFFFIYIKNPSKSGELSDLISGNLKPEASDIESMMKSAENKKFGVEGRVVAKALKGWAFGEESMTKFAESAMERERRTLDKRLVVLSTLGNNAPFIGLLGTVLGILKAFRDLANAADAGPAVVMHGISEALWATAFGLVVAIPAVIIYNLFSKAVKSKLSNAQEMVDLLLAVRVAYEEDPEAAKSVKIQNSDAQSE